MTEIIPSYLNELITTEMITRYPDTAIAVEYLLLKDSTPKLTTEQIADALANKFNFPSTRQGLHYRLEQWRNDGTMRQAEQIYLVPKLEEMRAAVGRAVTALPDIIDRLIREALSGKSAKNALDITNFLMQMANGELSKVAAPGDQEKAYLAKPRSFMPLDIAD